MLDGPVVGDNHPIMSVTQPGSGSARPAAFEAARAELTADVQRGAGGRGALERYSDRVDALLRQLFAEAGPSDGVAILALGGYGRRHRSEEHTSELQSPCHLVCRLLPV